MIEASAVLLVSRRPRRSDGVTGFPVGGTEPFVALARRSDDAKVYPGYWECPCGKQEVHPLDGKIEGPSIAACRELEEETGLIIPSTLGMMHAGALRVRGDGPLNAYVSLYTLEVAGDTALRHAEPTKRSPWQWVPLWHFLRTNDVWNHQGKPLTIATWTLIQIAILNYKLDDFVEGR